jgi:hypothetical protein
MRHSANALTPKVLEITTFLLVGSSCSNKKVGFDICCTAKVNLTRLEFASVLEFRWFSRGFKRFTISIHHPEIFVSLFR